MPFLDDQAGLVASDISRLISVGDVIMSLVGTPRTGFLLADHSLLDELVYPELFAKIGYTWNIGGEPAGFFRLPPSGGLSPMGAGVTAGYTARTIGQYFGEESHILSVAELASHNHTQNSHNHTQNSHNHTQNQHTHSVTDPGHNHTQNSHNHTQNAHSHRIQNKILVNEGAGIAVGTGASGWQQTDAATYNTNSETATNIAATATNISNTTGLTNQNTTATNIAETATNNSETATNNPSGSDVGHNTIHPVVVWYFFVRYE